MKIMGEYSKFISGKRRSVATPKSMVNKDGSCVFGTFDKEFEDMDILKLKKPTGAPQFMNKLKLTLWEATEVHLKNGVLLAVCCDMGIFGKVLHVFYDKRTRKVYCWDTNLKSRRQRLPPTLSTAASRRRQPGQGKSNTSMTSTRAGAVSAAYTNPTRRRLSTISSLRV